MSDKFHAGQIIYLASDGTQMTVVRYAGYLHKLGFPTTKVLCTWEDGEGKQHKQVFDEADLLTEQEAMERRLNA